MDQFESSSTMLRRNHRLRTVQAVFLRSSLSRASASFRQALRQRSMSVSDVDRPRLSRTAPCASLGPIPWLPARARAEPCRTNSGARGHRDARQIEADEGGFGPHARTVNRVVLGSRGSVAPRNDDAGASPQAASKPVPQACRRARPPRARPWPPARPHRSRQFQRHFRSRREAALLAAAPQKRLEPWTPSAKISAPMPFGPPILCADSVRRSAPS